MTEQVVAIDLKSVAWIGFSEQAAIVLQAGSNPEPPDHLAADALRQLVESREFRYITLAGARLLCHDGALRVWSTTHSSIMGYSKEAWPWNPHEPADWLAHRTTWVPGIEKPLESFFTQKGNCVEFGTFSRFRVGDFGNLGLSTLQIVDDMQMFAEQTPLLPELGVLMGVAGAVPPITTRVPWFYSALGGLLCCDGYYEVVLVPSSFPNQAFYIDDAKVGQHDPFADPNVDSWRRAMWRFLMTPPGQDVMDAPADPLVFRGNVLTGERPRRRLV